MPLLACDDSGTDEERNVIRFDADLDPVSLVFGDTAEGGLPAIEVFNPDTTVDVFGYAINEAGNFGDAGTYCKLQWQGTETGLKSSAEIEYTNVSGSIYITGGVELTLETWADVGGYCSGSFSGIVDGVVINNGFFSLKRAADSSFIY